MEQTSKMNYMQIDSRFWVFTDPQIVECKYDENMGAFVIKTSIQIFREEKTKQENSKSEPSKSIDELTEGLLDV